MNLTTIISGVVSFFNHPFFIVVGGLTTTLVILGIFYKILFIFFGITPVVFRLGVALWKRKIAVFATTEAYSSLFTSIKDSRIFNSGNIEMIPKNNIDKAKNFTVILVDWESCGDKINQIFSARKNDQTPILIYAKPGSIPQNQMEKIANRTNTIVVNFRGRLINDILTSLITTSYESK